MSPKPSILRATHLVKGYTTGTQRVLALNDVSIEIEQQNFVAIMGPSGSGKSTLLHLLGLLDTPDEGDVWINGIHTRGLKDDPLTFLRRDHLGFVFQDFELIPTLSVRENILLPSQLSGQLKSAEKRLPELLDRLGIQTRPNAKPTELSGGQQQRVAIARALIHQPWVVLADEPTGNLDSKNGQDVLGIFKQGVKEWGLTVVMVTHDPKAALQADQIVFLKDGLLAGKVDTQTPEARRQIEAFVGV